MNIQETLTAQRRFFQSGATLPVSFRIGMLKRLRSALDLSLIHISEPTRPY